jgi:hypothetical protein
MRVFISNTTSGSPRYIVTSVFLSYSGDIFTARRTMPVSTADGLKALVAVTRAAYELKWTHTFPFIPS